MPKRTYTIEWDSPDEEHWLPPDNVAVALHSYCPNTRFVVTEAAQQNVQRTAIALSVLVFLIFGGGIVIGWLYL